jgi:glycerophosphoryl diester phosphodiesterase
MINTHPLRIAHRGDTINYPENTLEGFASAFEHGAEGVELDVQLRAGKLVVVHDFLAPMLDTADGEPALPTLAEVLDRHSGQGRLQLDIKALDLEFLPPLKALVDQHETADLEIISNIWPIVPAIRETFPTHNLGVIFPMKEFEPWMDEAFVCMKVVKLATLMRGNTVHMFSRIIEENPAVVEACHDSQFKVHGHIEEGEQDVEVAVYQMLGNLGVDQVTFNNVASIRELSGTERSEPVL